VPVKSDQGDRLSLLCMGADGHPRSSAYQDDRTAIMETDEAAQWRLRTLLQ
jgi:hypothetical protein